MKKVFCIGMNKTGTTSLNRFMEVHGYKTGNQPSGEMLMRDYANRDWEPILNHCENADFFQDLPFSAPKTAVVLKENYPEALYILTIRNSAEEWYRSLTNYHAEKFGQEGRLPTKEDLQRASYRYKGFAWVANRALYDSPESDPYQKKALIKSYTDHIENIKNLFGDDKNLLMLNVANSNAVEKLAGFLGVKPLLAEMPHLNQSPGSR